MKKIAFKEKASQKIYNDYLKRIERCTSILSKEDRQDILMEFNSHIYEGMQRPSKASEIDQLLETIERLGAPEEVLKPMVAEKKLLQATKTFNPKHVFQAIVLNIANGISYIFFAIIYLFLFSFFFLIGAKIIAPEKTGLYMNDGQFRALGYTNETGAVEVLGHWFIPVMILAAVALYFIITMLLRLKRKAIE